MFIDDEGVCGACRVAERKKLVDWTERERELVALLDRYRRSDGRPDVLCPSSGGKDSIYAAHILREKYGMHVLTCTWAPHERTDVGTRNFYRMLALGFDNVLVTPNPRVHRKLTRLAFQNLGHPFQPFVLGQRNVATLAANFGIGLVFYGEDDADYEGEAGWQEKSEVPVEPRIAGLTFAELIEQHGFTAHDLKVYQPKPADAVVRALGHYLRWDPQSAYYYAVEHAGFEANAERTEGTYSRYNSIDDKLDPLHYYTMWAKFGVGRASHDASQEIRNGYLTREEGVALVHQYDGELRPSTVAWACDYMEITYDEFWATLARFTRDYPRVS